MNLIRVRVGNVKKGICFKEIREMVDFVEYFMLWCYLE